MSTIDTIEYIDKRLKTSRNNKIPSAFIGLDQSKAFLMTEHSILLSTLKHIGFDHNILSLMLSYFENRKQIVY